METLIDFVGLLLFYVYKFEVVHDHVVLALELVELHLDDLLLFQQPLDGFFFVHQLLLQPLDGLQLELDLLLQVFERSPSFLALVQFVLELLDQLLGSLQFLVCVFALERHFVDVHSRLHILGFLAEVERIESLLVVRDRLGHGANDGSLRITSEGRLEDSGEFGVSVVDEQLLASGLLAELVDDITERQQRPVDVLTLSQSDTLGLRFAGAFGSCKIDEVQLRDFHFASSRTGVTRLDVDSEDRVTSGTELVEFGGGDVSELIALAHEVHHVIERLDLLLAESVDVDAVGNALTDIEILVFWLDEIIDTLVVNLHIADRNVECPLLLGDESEDVLDRQRNQTGDLVVLVWISFHGVRLSRAGLTVRKHGLVYAVHGCFNYVPNLSVENLLCSDIISENFVKLEDFFGALVHKATVRDPGPHVVLLVGRFRLAQRLNTQGNVDLTFHLGLSNIKNNENLLL